MRCPKCRKITGVLFTDSENKYKCPFCSEKFVSYGNDKESMAELLKQLADDYGKELFLNTARINAILMDYVPDKRKERKLILNIMRENAVNELIRLYGKSDGETLSEIKKISHRIAEDICITESASEYALMSVAYALGLAVSGGLPDSFMNTVSETQAEPQKKVFTKKMKISGNEIDGSCNAVGFRAYSADKNLTEIILPETVTAIYPKAFINCINLKKIYLPSELKSIGTCAFEGCSSLESINVHENGVYIVKDGILLDKRTKSAVRAENSRNRQKYIIPENTERICRKAFDYNNAETIKLPRSLKIIEPDAFYMTTSLKYIETDSGNRNFSSYEGVLHNRRGNILLKYPPSVADAGYYFEDRVEEVGYRAFSCAVNLKTVTFTGNLRKIGDKAFEYCTGLERFMFPMNLVSIGNYAFYRCESLENIIISRKVTEIGSLAFAGCVNLKNVTIGESVKYIGEGAFNDCPNLEITIRNNSYAEMYCKSRNIKYKL